MKKLISELLYDLAKKEGYDDVMALVEIWIIDKALKEFDGNCEHASQAIHMKRTTMVEKRKRYGFKIKDKRKVYAL